MARTSAPINHRDDAWTRRVAVFGTLVVAGANGVLSFHSLASVAADEGFPEGWGWLFPIGVDSMMLTMAVVALHGAMRGMRLWFAYAGTFLGAAVSVYGNVMYAYDGSILRIILHSVPPLFLLMSVEGVFYMYRVRLDDRAVQEQEDAREAAREAKAEARRQSQIARQQEKAPRATALASTALASTVRAAAAATLDKARVAAIEGVLAGAEYKALVDANTANVDLAVFVMERVPGTTNLDLTHAGFLSLPTDEGRAHRDRVRAAWKKASERMEAGASSADGSSDKGEQSVAALAGDSEADRRVLSAA
ncbi:hypothetical protein Lsed01_00836 [Demequina sediminis]|uniref:DUF2637 domain-containing protein n=2 Tax=Demequina sediminis TaxID=1930058 RepID=A0ABP9WEZ6_9MICO|nr:hypothetical protein GCM10025873_23000 [Demequina sediminis]